MPDAEEDSYANTGEHPLQARFNKNPVEPKLPRAGGRFEAVQRLLQATNLSLLSSNMKLSWPTPEAKAATQRARRPPTLHDGSPIDFRISISTNAAHGAAISFSPTRLPPFSISAEGTCLPHDWR
ncbi:hypothetical protein EDB86DRAFT_3079133 [Lactarius hatsudake]|nr:hypothetical protein EDB86DRAFT_3079133 [Lactarius hatsudake]